MAEQAAGQQRVAALRLQQGGGQHAHRLVGRNADAAGRKGFFHLRAVRGVAAGLLDHAGALHAQLAWLLQALVLNAVGIQSRDHIGVAGRNPPGLRIGHRLGLAIADHRHGPGGIAAFPAQLLPARCRRQRTRVGHALEGQLRDRLLQALPGHHQFGGPRGAVGAFGGGNARGIAGHHAQRHFQQHVVAEHALAIGLEPVVLHQHGGDAGKVAVAGGIARAFRRVAQARARVVFVDQAGVDGGGVALRAQRGIDRRGEALLQPAGSGARACIRAPASEGVGDVVLMIQPFADMQVDVQRGVQPVQQRHHRAGFRRLEVEIVAIEVDAARGAVPARPLRATQGRAHQRAALLVAIHIEDRHEHEIHLVQQRALAALRDVAQQHQAGVLAIDLAGVDAGLRQHHGFAGCSLAGAHQQQVAAFAAGAEHLQRQQWRGGDQALQPRAGVRITGRADEVAAFGRSCPLGVRLHHQRLAGAMPGAHRRQRRAGIQGWLRGRVQAGQQGQREQVGTGVCAARRGGGVTADGVAGGGAGQAAVLGRRHAVISGLVDEYGVDAAIFRNRITLQFLVLQ